MPETEKETTTIMVNKSTSELLNGLKRGREKYDDVILRLYNREVDVDTKIICIDNDLPQLHTLVLQLGDDPDILYFFNGADFSPIKPEEANKMMKQPRPFFMMTQKEIEMFVVRRKDYSGLDHIKFFDRVSKWMETQPK